MKKDYSYYYNQYKNESTETLNKILFQIDMIDRWNAEDYAAHDAISGILLSRMAPKERKPIKSEYKIIKAHKPNGEQWYPNNWNSKLAGKTIRFSLKQG